MVLGDNDIKNRDSEMKTDLELILTNHLINDILLSALSTRTLNILSVRELLKERNSTFINLLNTTKIAILIPEIAEEYGYDKAIDISSGIGKPLPYIELQRNNVVELNANGSCNFYVEGI